MTKSTDGDTFLKQVISAFVSVTHIIAFFQIVICSRHMAVAFNIPAKNIGIYFAKLYSLRSLLMSMGCAVEYIIYRASNINIRRYSSIGWFVLLTVCEVSFLIVLYSSKNVAYHNYVVLNLEGLIFGFFQMSILSLIPEFAPYYMLSLYVSGTCIFIIQTIIDKCTKNSMLSVKIQSWICVLCSLICVPSWIYYLICLYKEPTQNTGSTESSDSNSNGCRSKRSLGSRCGQDSDHIYQSNDSKIEYLISMSSVSIMKIMTDKLDELCSKLSSEAVMNVQMLIGRLQQITQESQITYDMLVAIDLVILSLKKCQCPQGQLCLLADLSLLLRMKVLIKPLGEQNQEQPTISQEVSYSYDSLGVQRGERCSTGEPVVLASARYMGLIKSEKTPTEVQTRSEESSTQRPGRQRRSAQENNTSKKELYDHLLSSLSQLLMFPVGSLVKDFLFPGVIPYGLLERDKCHVINLIVIIFLSIGPVAVFVLSLILKDTFKKDNTWIHLCWSCMIPKILILIISLCAIHTKQSSTHKIRSSRWRVFIMTMILLTCYGFLETMSFVGMAFYVKFISCDPSGTADLQAIHNVFGKFFRYFVYKLSVGYNKTRIGAGFVLPNFKPPEPIPRGFCFWFKGAFSNGGKDIKGDFRMGIKQYLAVTEAVSKKSPIDTLRFCDVLM